MQYKNIEIHGAAELIECEDGGVRWLRVPRSVYDAMENDHGKKMCYNNTGIELRFVVKGDKAKIRLASATGLDTVLHYNVFFGGVQGGWNTFGEGGVLFGKEFELVIDKPADIDLLRKVSCDSDYDWDPEVVRVIINRGLFKIMDVEGDVCPPTKEQMPKNTILAYGSSITHGSNAIAKSNSWASMTAHRFNADLINLGIPGSCCMEPMLVDYIARLGEEGRWNTAILELGINVLRWEIPMIYERVSNTLEQIAGRNSDKRIYVISPVYCSADYHKEDSAEKWRSTIESIVKEKSYENVEYINGLDLLSHVSGLTADLVHPNIYGIEKIADGLAKRIKI